MTKRITGRKLQAIRKYHQDLDPLCVECQRLGLPPRAWTQLDHIVALVNGGQDEPSNRQGLCDEHHKAKTEQDLGRPAPRRIGVDGFPEAQATPVPARSAEALHGAPRGRGRGK